MSNLFYLEQHFRIVMGTAVVAYAAWSSMWWLLPFGFILLYTGSVKFCPIYHLFGVNEADLQRDRMLSMLPRNNPEPVFIFNNAGDLVFRNDAARDILPSLTSLEGLQQQEDLTAYGGSHQDAVQGFHENGQSYMLQYKNLPDEKVIVAYGFNVTDLVKANEEIISTQKELLYRMGEIGETRSKETGNHVKRVAEYSRLLGLLAGLPADEAELLKMASPMHDIGKVAIPDRVLLKPGKLDAEEWEIMQTHAEIGYELLRHSDRPILKAAAIVAGQHHEKWNGSGYPNGLSGEAIHIFGRITALVDVFDALASERVYKAAWPMEKVLKLIEEEKGQHFDPHLVELLLDHLPQFLAVRDRYVDSISEAA